MLAKQPIVGAREPEVFDAKKPDMRISYLLDSGVKIDIPIEIKWAGHAEVWDATDSQILTAAEPLLTPALLSSEPIISLGSDSMLRRLIDEAFAKAGVSVVSSVEAMMSAQAALLAHEGLGIAIIDPFTAVAFQHPGLVLKPMQPFVPYDYAMLTAAHNEPSRLAQAFIEIALKRVEAVRQTIEGIYMSAPAPFA
ncbi:LysR family transcriptional regulator [Caballeronia sordidicola]|uniref:LysR family transcriptional regulator n=2 Tax=Caballeronia sordidicola TaxID=196367 RepID=A0A158HG74_CABSO|nr:LysR family transcriptional regulator [Caballeronia sordidicola]